MLAKLVRCAAVCVLIAPQAVGNAQQPKDYTVERGTAIDMPLERAVAEADAIWVGRVTDAVVKFAPSDPPPDPLGFKKIVTEYTMGVREAIKGDAQRVSGPGVFWMLGGRSVAGRATPDGESFLRLGQTYVVMLRWNAHASMYELNNAGESTWELTNERVRAVGKGKDAKGYDGERPDRFLAIVKRLAVSGKGRK